MLFIARGVFLLCVLPPLEGWDEYQHVAYIAYLDENGEPPVLSDECTVPRSMYPALVALPHAGFGIEQLGRIGARDYEDFWSADLKPQVRPDAPDIPLYQAQHAPLYYRLALPVYRASGRAGDLLSVISSLRLVNLLLGAVSLAVALAAIGFVVRDGRPRFVIGILVALQPMFLLNSARVANDALGVLLGTLAIAWLLLMSKRNILFAAAGGGLLVGAAILAKSVNIALIPFALFVLVRPVWNGGRQATLSALGIAGFALAAGLVTFNHFEANLNRFGMLTPMQEAVSNRAAGLTANGFVQSAMKVDWLEEAWRLLSRKTLWVGGWSMIPPPRLLVKLHQGVILAAMIGAWFALSASRRRERRIIDPAGSLPVIILCLGIGAGLCYHGIHSQIAWGRVATNSWYAAIAFPWMLVLVVQGLNLLPGKRAGMTLGVALAAVYALTELTGVLFLMAPIYAASTEPSIIWQRLSIMHPAYLGPAVGLLSLASVVALTSFAFGVLWKNGGSQGEREKAVTS